MKIRNGFVSNSSSSSFVIYGVILNSGEIFNIARNTFDDFKDIDIDEMEDSYPTEILEELCQLELYEELGFAEDSDNDRYYIGASYTDIKDNETLAEFKSRIKENLKQLTGDSNVYEQTCWHEEVIYG